MLAYNKKHQPFERLVGAFAEMYLLGGVCVYLAFNRIITRF